MGNHGTTHARHAAGKMLHRLHSLQVESNPNCLSRPWNPPQIGQRHILTPESTDFENLPVLAIRRREIASRPWISFRSRMVSAILFFAPFKKSFTSTTKYQLKRKSLLE